MKTVLTEAQKARLSEIQATLHSNPELSMQEHETTRLIRDVLQSLGLELLDFGLETGVVARLAGAGTGPCVALRADIDALMQQEAVERPDRSKRDGVMHACGHDVHITGLLGAAMLLSERRTSLPGDVIFVFQPGEETVAGAKLLIERGLFDRVKIDRMFGLHNTPTLDVGAVGVKEGSLMAAKDGFTVTVRGRGGHGGIPDRCVDPVVAGCGIVSALQTVVSRNVNPEDVAVLSICSIHSGETDNRIPDELQFTIGLRTMLPEVEERTVARIYEIVENGAKAYGCTAEIDHYGHTPPVINGPEMTALAMLAAKATTEPARVVPPALCMASDDFAEFGRFVPAFYYFLGSGVPGAENPSWHSAHFRAAPESSFFGAQLLANSVLAAEGLL